MSSICPAFPSVPVNENVYCFGERRQKWPTFTFRVCLDPTAQHVSSVQTFAHLDNDESIDPATAAETQHFVPTELDTAGQTPQAQQMEGVNKSEAQDEQPEVEPHRKLTIWTQIQIDIMREKVERENALICPYQPTFSPMQGLEADAPCSNVTAAVCSIPRKRRCPGSSYDGVAHDRKRRRCNEDG
jgi:hypothetical protein